MRYAKVLLIWLLPTILLVLSLFSLPYPAYYGLFLQIVVSVTAAIIAYFLFTQRPKYYIIWGIVFVLIVLIYNPILHLSITMGIDVPLALVTAILYITNWWFVFRKRT